MNKIETLSFFSGKRVLLTGHTGFKGAWLSRILIHAGAELIGYSLDSAKDPSLFALADIKSRIKHIPGDIRDFEKLRNVFSKYQPEIVIHFAAQPLVRESYIAPHYTYETNVLGTLNLLECSRLTSSVRSILNVTTDKVYLNREWPWGYREIEQLDGYDPYSNSKSCSELVTHSYYNSFFRESGIPVSTARAGNVIGGGDFAADRIIPDCIRSIKNGSELIIRNPNSIRPYQHVLEPLFAYLCIVKSQSVDNQKSGWYNVGPNEDDCVTTGRLVEIFANQWGSDFKWKVCPNPSAPHEANFLKLDCSKIKSVLNWNSTWNIENAVQKTVEWTQVWMNGGDIPAEMDREISEFLNCNK